MGEELCYMYPRLSLGNTQNVSISTRRSSSIKTSCIVLLAATLPGTGVKPDRRTEPVCTTDNQYSLHETASWTINTMPFCSIIHATHKERRSV